MHKPLTDIIMEKIKNGEQQSLHSCIFVAGGINKAVSLERNARKLERIKKRVFGRRSIELKQISKSYARSDILEDLSEFFQSLKINSNGKREYRPQIVLDSILSNAEYKRGDTLALVSIFNILTHYCGVKNVGAYECNGYYFSRYIFPKSGSGLSYPVRKISLSEHKERMKSKKQIFNKDLIAITAARTAEHLRRSGLKSKAQKFEDYSRFFASLDDNFFGELNPQ